MEEIWKDIPGYEKYYMASTLGRIKSKDRVIKTVLKGKEIKYIKRGRIMTPCLNSSKYLGLPINTDKLKKSENVHRLIAITFLPNPNNLPCVNHKDENKLNNCVDNLEWCTKSYNHSYGTCIERTSEKQRLTHSNCITIVGYKENEIIEFHSISSASRYFNVSHAAISKAIRRGNKCKGYNWKYKI